MPAQDSEQHEYLWNTTVKKAPGACHFPFERSALCCIEANKFVYHWKLQKEKEMTRHQVSNLQARKAQAAKDVLSACLATRCHRHRAHRIWWDLSTWACLFLISIPRFSVTLFPYQFVGQLRFLLPVPCLPGSQWNWALSKKQCNPLNLCGNISVKLHRDLPCIGPCSFQNQHLSKNHMWWDAEERKPRSYIMGGKWGHGTTLQERALRPFKPLHQRVKDELTPRKGSSCSA